MSTGRHAKRKLLPKFRMDIESVVCVCVCVTFRDKATADLDLQSIVV